MMKKLFFIAVIIYGCQGKSDSEKLREMRDSIVTMNSNQELQNLKDSLSSRTIIKQREDYAVPADSEAMKSMEKEATK